MNADQVSLLITPRAATDLAAAGCGHRDGSLRSEPLIFAGVVAGVTLFVGPRGTVVMTSTDSPRAARRTVWSV